MTNIKNELITPVIFKLDKGLESPVAFFPWEPGDRYNCTLLSYAHVGQHSIAHIDYARACRPATKKQYSPLLRELKAMGYTLKIRRRMSRTDHMVRALKDQS